MKLKDAMSSQQITAWLLALLALFCATPSLCTAGLLPFWNQFGDYTADRSNGDQFGYDLEVFDVDGDSHQDLLISAILYDDHTDSTCCNFSFHPGAVYLLKGPLNADSTAVLMADGRRILDLNPSPPYTGIPTCRNTEFGRRVETGVGFTDSLARQVFVSLHKYNRYWDPPGPIENLRASESGRVEVYSWDGSGLSVADSLMPIEKFTDQWFGHDIAVLDYNGDGRDDIAVSTNPQTAMVHIFLGQNDPPSPGFRYPDMTIGDVTSSIGGNYVFNLGKLGGGTKEFLGISDTNYDTNKGRLYVFEYDALADSHLTLTGNREFVITGNAGDSIGYMAAGGVDVTGDTGSDLDIVVSGSALLYIFEGPFTTGSGLTPANAFGKITAVNHVGGHQRNSLTVDTDHDGDGVVDILLGRDAGGTYDYVNLIYGGDYLSGTQTLEDLSRPSIEIQSPDLQFGSSVASGILTTGGAPVFLAGATEAFPASGIRLGEVSAYLYPLLEASEASNIATGADAIYSSIPMDYDSDGKADLVISKPDADKYAHVYRNMSESGEPSVFLRMNTELAGFFSTGEDPAALRGLSAADIDNDGDLDFFGASSGLARLYRNTGGDTPRFDDVALSVGLSVTSSWAGAWGDYNRDGYVDLYIARAGGSAEPGSITALVDRLYKNRTDEVSTLSFVADASNAGLDTRASKTIGCSWGDANGDGFVDLFVSHLGALDTVNFGWSPLYINDGDATFTDVAGSATAPKVPKLGNVSSVGWADIDGDTYLDLVLGRETTSATDDRLIVYANSVTGSGEYVDTRTIDVGAADLPSLRGVVVADLDLDGMFDIMGAPDGSTDLPPVLINDLDDTDKLINMSGLYGMKAGAADGITASDFNADGDPDVYLGRIESTDAFFYENNANNDQDLNWVTVTLSSESKANNASGIGAVVTVDDATNEYVQIVDGGSGRGGQQAGVLTYGLEDYAGAVEVTVKWPDGYTNQTQTLIDPTGDSVSMVDDHNPILDNNSVTFHAIVRPDDTVDWLFSWKTQYSSTGSLDTVEILTSGCSSTTVLTPATSGVLHDITPLTDGKYLHELTWSDQSCSLGCTITYQVGSEVSTPDHDPVKSTVKTYKTKFCLQ